MRTGLKVALSGWHANRAARAAAMLDGYMPTVLPRKPQQDNLMLTITGSKQVSLLTLSLLSLYINSVSLPRIKVVVDLKSSRDDIAAALSWWPGELLVISGMNLVQQWDLSDRNYLADFARHHLHGLKLGAICELARGESLVYFDTDTLWSNSVEKLTYGIDLSKEVILKVSRDMSFSYDNGLLNAIGTTITHRLNAGLMFARGDLFKATDMENWIRSALQLPPHPWWTEQTIFALASIHLGSEPWPMNVARMSLSDYWFPRPNFLRPRQVVRHYAGLEQRNLFWVDAERIRKLAGQLG